MSEREQLHSLTAARGIAAWMVVLYHMRASVPWLPHSLFMVVDKGYLAVDFFFLLSGFVITLSAGPDFAARGIAALPDFLKRRAARIYPLYAVMLCLTVLFALVLMATGRDASGYPWRELPLHVLMLQNWGFTSALSWNHPAWSISTEFAAYLLFPLLAVGLIARRLPMGVLAAGMAGAIALMAVVLARMGHNDLGADIPHTGIIRCLCEFAAGCLLCLLWNKRRDHCGMPLGALAAMAAGGVAMIRLRDEGAELWAFPLMALALIILLARLSQGRERPERWPAALRLFVYLGEISYATYLSHFMLFIWFKIAFVDETGQVSPGLAALFLLIALGVSVLLYHGVERPGRALVRPARRTGLAPRAA